MSENVILVSDTNNVVILDDSTIEVIEVATSTDLTAEAQYLYGQMAIVSAAAEVSAENAEGFADSAGVYANDASLSASNAFSYSNAASVSANDAFSSAQTATSQAGLAGNYADAAFSSETNAGIFANDAFASAGLAEGFATSAGISEANASIYANDALQSANDAQYYFEQIGEMQDFFDIDIEGGLMPAENPTVSTQFELDGNGDIMPKEA